MATGVGFATVGFATGAGFVEAELGTGAGFGVEAPLSTVAG